MQGIYCRLLQLTDKECVKKALAAFINVAKAPSSLKIR